MKKLLLLAIFIMQFCSVANAELFCVEKNFNAAKLSCTEKQQATVFEDSELKVTLEGMQFDFINKKSTPSLIYRRANDKNTTQIIRQVKLNKEEAKYLAYLCVGADFTFENKTQETIFIDLSKSRVSIGEYMGAPLLTKPNSSTYKLMPPPPIILMPKQKIKRTLYRGDYVREDQNDRKKIKWTIAKEDMYLNQNLFGSKGCIFNVGFDEKLAQSHKVFSICTWTITAEDLKHSRCDYKTYQLEHFKSNMPKLKNYSL